MVCGPNIKAFFLKNPTIKNHTIVVEINEATNYLKLLPIINMQGFFFLKTQTNYWVKIKKYKINPPITAEELQNIAEENFKYYKKPNTTTKMWVVYETSSANTAPPFF